MRTIGVLVQKGPNAKDPPRVLNFEQHRRLLKEMYSAMGKPAPWEIAEREIEGERKAVGVAVTEAAGV